MSAPVVPSPLDALRGRRFLLTPTIDTAQANDWRLGLQTWGDIQIINFHTGREVWIPRNCVAGLCDDEETMPVVALNQPVRLQDGLVMCQGARVLQMPASPGRSAFRFKQNRSESAVAQIYAADQFWAQTAAGRRMWAAIAAALVPAIVYALLLN
jgi:hypothetical protein